VQGVPAAILKSAMCGEVYTKAAIWPQTRDWLHFKVQLSEGVGKRGALSGKTEDLERQNSGYPDAALP